MGNGCHIKIIHQGNIRLAMVSALPMQWSTSWRSDHRWKMWIPMSFSESPVYFCLFYVHIWSHDDRFSKPDPGPLFLSEVPDADNLQPFDVFGEGFVEDDIWRDAQMPQVIRYLYGGTGTQVPPEWQFVIPKKIWKSDYNWHPNAGWIVNRRFWWTLDKIRSVLDKIRSVLDQFQKKNP